MSNIKKWLRDTYTNKSDDFVYSRNVKWWTRLNDSYTKDPKAPHADLSSAEKHAVDEFYLTYYGEKIPYDYHELQKGLHDGRFDEKIIPLWFYYCNIDYFLNALRLYGDVIDDKNVTHLLADAADVAMPKTIWANVQGLNIDGAGAFLTIDEIDRRLADYGQVFVKPSVDSCGGSGCKLYALADLAVTGKGSAAQQILAVYGSNFIVQEKVIAHESVSAPHPSSLNTFRVVTYVKDGKINHGNTVLRVGRHGSVVDNASAGGMVVGVHDDGSLEPMAYSGHYDFKCHIHPDSGYEFGSQVVDLYPKVLAACEKMHATMPQLKLVNWDMTIGQDGRPILVETNSAQSGGFELAQTAFGTGAFGQDTAELLKFSRRLRDLPKVKRDQVIIQGDIWN